MSYLGRTIGCPTCPADEAKGETPRQWHNLNDVPHDVVVQDIDGDRYHWVNRLGWYWDGMQRILDAEDMIVNPSFAPFTEVPEVLNA